MLVYLICYAAAYLFSRAGAFLLSGAALMFAAAVLFAEDMRGPGLNVRLRALFSLSFVGGQGVSALKLSSLQVPWETETWVVLFLAYTVFWLVFEWLKARSGGVPQNGRAERMYPIRGKRLLISIVGITALSWAAFLLEAVLLGFVPLFMRGVPHAYSYFHVSGVHYFTVSCCLVPAFAVVWHETARSPRPAEKKAVYASVILSFLVPLLCVSRFQLILAALLAFVTFLVMERGHVPGWSAAVLVLCLVPLYVILSVARSHSVEYLNGIFEMKARFPIFISQPYIYIANNYDNLNCLIRDLPAHTHGVRILYPVWGLTGLKFVFPGLVSSPLYVTKTELTTLTLFYDAWYDFGTPGVVAFSALLGAVSFRLERMLYEMHHPVISVLYAEFAVYLSLAFFTTWFSNPATWFYFAATLAVILFTGGGRR